MCKTMGDKSSGGTSWDEEKEFRFQSPWNKPSVLLKAGRWIFQLRDVGCGHILGMLSRTLASFVYRAASPWLLHGTGMGLGILSWVWNGPGIARELGQQLLPLPSAAFCAAACRKAGNFRRDFCRASPLLPSFSSPEGWSFPGNMFGISPLDCSLSGSTWGGAAQP